MAIRPFVKWAGGKRQLVDQLRCRIPARYGTYFEPFLGGGALFFALASEPEFAPRRAVLNDVNEDLMMAYAVVRDSVEALIEDLELRQATYLSAGPEQRAEIYYSIRDDEAVKSEVAAASRLIFLNKTCFNGLYRVNSRGRFNVPHGSYSKPAILDEAVLRAASCALETTELLQMDYRRACDSAREGDFVYLDPPFYPLSDTANFTSYTVDPFGDREQLELKWFVDDLRDQNVSVMQSNSAHPWVVGAYRASKYVVEALPARRSISARGDRRIEVDELVVTNEYPRRGRIESLD